MTRTQKFWSTILTTDEELLDLLPTAQLENRLRMLRAERAPLRYRAAVKGALATR